MNYESIFKTVQYSEQASRNLFTNELYRGLEQVSDGKPTLFILGDRVRSNDPDSKARELALTPAFFGMDDSGKPTFFVGLPQSPNEIAMFLHANELHQFIQQRLDVSNIEIKYKPNSELSLMVGDDLVNNAIHVPLTFYPDSKNYVVLKRGEAKTPVATIQEIAQSHREWLSHVYANEQIEFPNIDVIVYDKKGNGVDPNVRFMRLENGLGSVSPHDISFVDARKNFQTFPFESLATLV